MLYILWFPNSPEYLQTEPKQSKFPWYATDLEIWIRFVSEACLLFDVPGLHDSIWSRLNSKNYEVFPNFD